MMHIHNMPAYRYTYKFSIVLWDEKAPLEMTSAYCSTGTNFTLWACLSHRSTFHIRPIGVGTTFLSSNDAGQHIRLVISQSL